MCTRNFPELVGHVWVCGRVRDIREGGRGGPPGVEGAGGETWTPFSLLNPSLVSNREHAEESRVATSRRRRSLGR